MSGLGTIRDPQPPDRPGSARRVAKAWKRLVRRRRSWQRRGRWRVVKSWLARNFGFGWVFYLRILVACVAIDIYFAVVAHPRTLVAWVPFDVVGVAVGVVAIGLFEAVLWARKRWLS